MNILVVDDEPLLREELAEYLTLAGYRTTEASDLASAIEALNDNCAVTALLTDIRLPDGSGLDLVRHIRDTPDLRSRVVPILMMTGHTDILDQIGGSHETTPILFKPIDLQRLARLLAADA